MLGIDFKVPELASVEEILPEGTPPEEAPLYLASLKASAYMPSLGADDLYITADTVVIIDNEIIGKPADEAAARTMLHQLSGRTHRVVTGVCVFTRGRMERLSVTTEVDFAPLTSEEIDYYVATYRPLDKAGAYGVQEWIGAVAVRSLRGSYYNVMGLPVNALYSLLRTF